MKDFKSKISTTIEQSKRLMSIGLNPETADMSIPIIDNPEYCCSARAYKNWNDFFKYKRLVIPSWSLSRLLELLPTEIPDNKKGFDPYHPELIIKPFGYIVSIRRATSDCLVGTHIEDSPIECCISMIDWLIKNKRFNKEYIKTNKDK